MDNYELAQKAQNLMIGQTLAQRLDQAVHDAEIRLEKAKKAREILNRYPDIEQLIDHLRYI